MNCANISLSLKVELMLCLYSSKITSSGFEVDKTPRINWVRATPATTSPDIVRATIQRWNHSLERIRFDITKYARKIVRLLITIDSEPMIFW